MGCFDAFFSKGLIYYENVSDCKPFKASCGQTVVSGRLKLPKSVRKYIKFDFYVGFKVGRCGPFDCGSLESNYPQKMSIFGTEKVVSTASKVN